MFNAKTAIRTAYTLTKNHWMGMANPHLGIKTKTDKNDLFNAKTALWFSLILLKVIRTAYTLTKKHWMGMTNPHQTAC